MIEHYLDNSATTRVSESAAEKAVEIMTSCYGNPSSLHSKGIAAENEMEAARRIIAASLGVDSGEIYFTSGGTEANNLALFGTAYAKKRTATKIITTALEHSSVIESARQLQKEGFEVIYLPAEGDGAISLEKLENAVDGDVCLVSVMAVNNETGVILPYEKIAKIIKAKKSTAYFHIDAVQAYGKLNLKANKIGADLISVSAHKIHGAKGVGALYVKKGVRLIARQYGGEQEKKLRPGTQAMPLIAAFGQAVSEFDIEKNYSYISELNSYAQEKLLRLEGVYKNSPDNSLPYILNISVEGIRSETMLHFLAAEGIYVSSGSACARGKKSHVLSALGLSAQRADSALRISFSKYNTKNDIDALYTALSTGINTLVRR